MRTPVIILGVVLLLLAATVVRWRYYTHDARVMDNATAFVMLSDSDTLCEVSGTNHTQKQKMQCSEVICYLQSQLKVQLGSTVGVTVFGKVLTERVEAVSVELIKSGYKVVGVMRVGFVAEPEQKR